MDSRVLVCCLLSKLKVEYGHEIGILEKENARKFDIEIACLYALSPLPTYSWVPRYGLGLLCTRVWIQNLLLLRLLTGPPLLLSCEL